MQAAFDSTQPNGTARRAPNDPVIYIFRLYRKLGVPGLGSLPPASGSGVSSILAGATSLIRTARNFLREDLLGPLQGRILEREYRFVMMAERVQELPEVRTHFQYTRAGYFIDTPFRNGRGVTFFRLSGRTHWTPVFVNGVAVDGDAAIKDFKELVDDYFFPRDGRSAADFELYWLNLNAPISAEDPYGEFEWLIHPFRSGIRTYQTAERPFSRFFEFEFAGLQSNRDKAKSEDGFLAGLLSKGILGTLLDTLHLSSVKDVLNGVFGAARELKGLFDDLGNVASAATDYVTGATQFIRGSIAQVRGLLNSVQTLVGRVEDGIDLARQLPGLVGADLTRLQRDFPGLTSADQGVIAADELRRVQDLLNALVAQPSAFMPVVATAPDATTVSANILPADTLEQIAARWGVDTQTLIDLNGLQYPFVDGRAHPTKQKAAYENEQAAAAAAIAEAQARAAAALAAGADRGKVDVALRYALAQANKRMAAATDAIAALAQLPPAVDGVLYAGDAVKIPQPQPDVGASIVEISPELAARIVTVTGEVVSLEDRLFGLDLLLDPDGNLEWDDVQRDVRLERALAHMANVQVRYVKLPLGQLRYAPNIGNFAFVDLARWQGPGTNQLLGYAIFNTLRQDPRVQKVRNVTAETKGGVARLSHDALLINQIATPTITAPLPS